MTGRPHDPDDARAIPQSGSQGGSGDDTEVYTVDVRGRRRGRSSDATEGSGATRVMPTTGPASGRPARQRSSTPPPPVDGGRADEWDDQPRRRRRFPVGRLVLLLVVAWVAFMVFTPLHAWNSVTKVDTTPGGTRPTDSKGYNYLLVGSDSRAGLTKEQRKEYATGNAAGRRTDSIILVHVPANGGKPALVSLPRDSYVPIPGHGSNKINAAFAFGGPNLLVETVEQVTDLHIDGYVEIGFAGFASVVDSVDGVNICVPFTMNDKKAGINLKKGCQVLNGKNALGYVRARYSDPRGDIGRAERQRQFLAAIMKKALTPSTVLIPTRYWSFSHAAAKGLIVGEDTSMRDASRVLLAMRAVSKDEGLSLVVPLSSLNYQTNAGSSVKWDTARAKALFTLLRNDTPLEAPPEGTDGKPSGN
ncbi:cell envelope-related function transcriptional attenuator common domain-containing protein [Pedococcus dokdonensis]|uniref:Cell envelope-related function transcriptional attenuator common domain-containing protein n=1 Tax=Pedococcus dokdonensis TaxID=443156 RepID=A0A1H0RHS4_9MICO|nr:LCP family protein [Pedococcus dokdonensis]SDP29112.1 cell envelope-related function transcriptional attenuator common domain-containing protein [Pedococcus dokdonensis]